MERAEYYRMIGGIRRFMPMGYQKCSVHITETEIGGRDHALLLLKRGETELMPVMSLEPYLERLEKGDGMTAVMVDIATDYAKMVSMQSRKQCRQMER